ncbi:signal peptidase II [Fundicoccus culcitae]|uniref:Lipoprotein signal peptidase n=1 Tax=Fundicoccus culcitae TaxID=2969821 RepID=A0ABY5P809_9LACT|nr:signal peptidase II [Fundicoccus culcitae]UUX34515.1 signal peptidase II [Fundicoccus culcitae]
MILSFFITILIVLLDQFLKNWVVDNLALFESMPGINGIFDFYHIRNDGAGWGLFSGQMWLFYLVTIIMMIYIVYLIYKNRHKGYVISIGLGLLLGGTIGNFIDRIRYGYVVDMFRLLFINFPIFNIADIALTVGVIVIILAILFHKDGDTIL